MICEHAAPMNEHVAALSDQNKCMERQNGLRPIFVNYFKVSIYHRVKAVTFRRVLADHGYDIDQLLEVWNAKKSVSTTCAKCEEEDFYICVCMWGLQEGLAEVLAPMEELKDDDKKELVELLDCHFDPEKQAVLPAVKKSKSRRKGDYLKNIN